MIDSRWGREDGESSSSTQSVDDVEMLSALDENEVAGEMGPWTSRENRKPDQDYATVA